METHFTQINNADEEHINYEKVYWQNASKIFFKFIYTVYVFKKDNYAKAGSKKLWNVKIQLLTCIQSQLCILSKPKEDTLEAVEEAKRQEEVDESSIVVQEQIYPIRENLSFRNTRKNVRRKVELFENL